MQASNANNNSIYNDPEWYFLAEFSLSELIVDVDQRGESTTGGLHQTIRDLGMPYECVENIDVTLKRFAKEVIVHNQQARLEIPGRIRLFCQKKLVSDSKLAETSRAHNAGRTLEQGYRIYHSRMELYGGWGYFLIERTRDSSAATSEIFHYFVDLYLYKEGE